MCKIIQSKVLLRETRSGLKTTGRHMIKRDKQLIRQTLHHIIADKIGNRILFKTDLTTMEEPDLGNTGENIPFFKGKYTENTGGGSSREIYARYAWKNLQDVRIFMILTVKEEFLQKVDLKKQTEIVGGIKMKVVLWYCMKEDQVIVTANYFIFIMMWA